MCTRGFAFFPSMYNYIVLHYILIMHVCIAMTSVVPHIIIIILLQYLSSSSSASISVLFYSCPDTGSASG